MLDVSQEKFKNAILRIPRRQYIQEEAESGKHKNIFELRAEVRHREVRENIDSTLDLLLEPYSTVEPKVERIVSSTFTELQKQFPSVAAIIIIGSGGHGGGLSEQYQDEMSETWIGALYLKMMFHQMKK